MPVLSRGRNLGPLRVLEHERRCPRRFTRDGGPFHVHVVAQFDDEVHRRQHFTSPGRRADVRTASAFDTGIQVNELFLVEVFDLIDAEDDFFIRLLRLFHR